MHTLTGFIVKGYLPGNTQYETLSNYRALIAPLRFGAGLKGKVADSWSVGTPVITTSIGAEGMGLGARNNDAAKTKDDVHLGSHFGARTPSQLLSQPSPQPETPPVTPAVGAFGGCISDDEDEFAMHACDVYTDANLFRSVQEKGFRAVRNEFDYHHHADILKNKITELLAVEDNSSSTTPKENATYLRKRRSDWTSNLLACESMRSTYYLSKFIQLKENTRDFCEKE